MGLIWDDQGGRSSISCQLVEGQGVEEATPEIVRGVSSHYELEGRIPVRRKNPQAGQSRRWEGPKTSRGLTDSITRNFG
jgi:hypothetical protein